MKTVLLANITGPRKGQRILKMKRSMMTIALMVAFSALLGLGSAALGATPLPYATGFESSDSFAPGSINGQGGWTVFGSVNDITTAAAHSGTQSLLVNPTAGDGNVVKSSTPIFDASGETPSMYNPTPVSDYMGTEFWFRTVATSSDTGLYVSTSMGNPASVRNTWLGVLEVTDYGASTSGDPRCDGVEPFHALNPLADRAHLRPICYGPSPSSPTR